MTDEIKSFAYEAPAVRELGSFEQITQALATGNFLDSTYSVHTALPVDHSS